MWHAMFSLGAPAGERVLRAALIYAFAVVALRIAGKRELGQLSTFDLVVLLFFSNILQNSIIGNDVSITGGVIGAVTLLALNHIVLRVIYRHRAVDALIEGQATFLVKDGALQDHALQRELVTLEELTLACHKQGVLDLGEVEQAVLEPDGSISVFARQPSKEDLAHRELLQRLDGLAARLDELSTRVQPAPTS